MKRKQHSEKGLGFIALCEDAFHLVRTAPARYLVCYYLGSMPFILALLYFWADMSFSAHAYGNIGRSALLLALCFVWMKCWQTVYMRQVMSWVRGEPAQRWTLRRVGRMAAMQSVTQSCGGVALVLSVLVALPFAWVYAFCQNATLFGDGEEERLSRVLERSWTQARLWPKQNHLAIWALSPMMVLIAAVFFLVAMPIMAEITPGWTELWLQAYALLLTLVVVPMSPFGCVVALNITAAMAMLPELARMLLGMQSITVSAVVGTGNVMFLVTVVGLTYLVMDPVMKAAYVLRCFHGESLHTGEDLRVELKAMLRRGRFVLLLLIGAAVLFGGSAHAAEEPEAGPVAQVDAAELDRALSEVLEQREYSWRMPRQKPEDVGNKSFFEHWMESIASVVKDAVQWVLDKLRAVVKAVVEFIESLFPDRAATPDGRGWVGGIKALFLILLASVAVALLFFLYRMWWKGRRKALDIIGQVVPAKPDLEDEGVSAADLPVDAWLDLANELMAKGEPRLALRALFLSTLAMLGQREMVKIAKFKSNREYENELRRRSHERPIMLAAFAENVGLFEGSWYGTHDVTDAILEAFNSNRDRIRRDVEQR